MCPLNNLTIYLFIDSEFRILSNILIEIQTTI